MHTDNVYDTFHNIICMTYVITTSLGARISRNSDANASEFS